MVSLQERSLERSSLAKLVVPGCFCRDDREDPKTRSTQYNNNAKESKKPRSMAMRSHQSARQGTGEGKQEAVR